MYIFESFEPNKIKQNGNEVEPATFCWRCLPRRPYEQWRIYEDRQEGNKAQRYIPWHSVFEEAYTKHMVMILDLPCLLWSRSHRLEVWGFLEVWEYRRKKAKLRVEGREFERCVFIIGFWRLCRERARLVFTCVHLILTLNVWEVCIYNRFLKA